MKGSMGPLGESEEWKPPKVGACGCTGCSWGAHRALCARCAKSRLFFTTGHHGSQGPEFCTLQPLLIHQGFFFSSLMLATGPRVLNSAPHVVLN